MSRRSAEPARAPLLPVSIPRACRLKRSASSGAAARRAGHVVGPLSNRLLVEAGFGATYFGFANFERNPNPTRDLIRVVEQCASGCAANGNIPGLAYRSQDFSDAYNGSYLWTGQCRM